ncbi:hypothetical protein AUR64_13460 [Haloprofundus marisrubri]|uniref:DUF58 domain-containing protein n=1 Tax=Haloprofundus marisrubri TaxID=1514971 RepID=A0A0W1R7E8_9EURY|nr:DUF58 domain-containing protein [Haloprofundus marisrubri]KTG08821.1 hypothetical protein AUR64_13460 [Haloprofundus marisrubri]
MRLTRRGAAVLGVCVAGFAAAELYGSRSLNAVVFPGLVALVAAVVQLRSFDEPTVRRSVPDDGFVGETHRVTLELTTEGTPYSADVVDHVGEGLSRRTESKTETTVGGDAISYDVTYERRGERTLGPLTVVARDVFGLLETEFTCRGTDRVLVYPALRRVPGWARAELSGVHGIGLTEDRDEFSTIREYRHGDPMRDVHWRSSAKRDDLIVTEYSADEERRAVTLTAGGQPKRADAMAEAVASLAFALLDAGVPVTVSVPSGRAVAEPTARDRRRVLELLARTDGGPPPDTTADVIVRAERDVVRILVDDRETSFETLTEKKRAADGSGVEDREMGAKRAAEARSGGQQSMGETA